MIDIKKADGSVEEMSIDEFTRWMCLVEAFNFIEQKAKLLAVDVSTMIKPLAIEEYVKERYASMRHDVECEHRLGLI